jgi:putative transposase
MLRGNGEQNIFMDAGDRTRFFLLLQESVERFEYRIHAFCLMTNHIHLALQVGQIPLSGIMQNVGFRYTQFVNRKYQRSGHLFQGRYKALLIDADSYLLELIRYIHLNPVRVGMASIPENYPWSSHASYLNLAPRPPWLTVEWALVQFADKKLSAIKRYRNFVEEGLEEGHREEFHRGSYEGRALGDDRFVERVLSQTEEVRQVDLKLDQIIESVCAVYQLTRAELRAPGKEQPAAEARAVAAYFVRRWQSVTLSELAAFFGRDPSGLSQAARRIDRRLGADGGLRRKLAKMEESLGISVCQA